MYLMLVAGYTFHSLQQPLSMCTPIWGMLYMLCVCFFFAPFVLLLPHDGVVAGLPCLNTQGSLRLRGQL